MGVYWQVCVGVCNCVCMCVLTGVYVLVGVCYRVYSRMSADVCVRVYRCVWVQVCECICIGMCVTDPPPLPPDLVYIFCTKNNIDYTPTHYTPLCGV